MNVKVVAFDLDDTLFPERQFALGGICAAGEWARSNLGLSKFGSKARELFESGVRAHLFDRTLGDLGHDSKQETIKGLVKAYREHLPKLEMYPDAHQAVSAMKGRYKLAIITDGWLEVQRSKIVALGLDSIFDLVLCTDELGRQKWKPSVAPFESVMQRLGSAGKRCVYVGDNPRKDFIGARSAGWYTIRIRRPVTEHYNYVPDKNEAADVEVTSLLELLQLLRPA